MPLFPRYRLTQLAVDPGAGPHRNHTVMFLGAEDGTVLKVLLGSTANTSLEPVLLEDINLYSPAR